MHSTEKEGLRLSVQPGDYGCCRLPASARIPRWVHRSDFFNLTRTDDELSILCRQEHVPADVKCERDWALIKVLGTLDFSLIGVLASMADPLARARIGLLTVSTYDTDYLMVRRNKLQDAIVALETAGHRFEDGAGEAAEAAAPEPEPAAPEPAAPEADDGGPGSVRRAPKRRRRTRRRSAAPKVDDGAPVSEEAPAPQVTEAAETAEAESRDEGETEAVTTRRRRRSSRTRRRAAAAPKGDDAAETAVAATSSDSSKATKSTKSGKTAKSASADDTKPPRGRAKGRGRSRSRSRGGRARSGGSLYIGEEWEHIEEDASEGPVTFAAAFEDDE
ncbi:MAG: ACT domain-containing protein, partial [Acidobacteriota bacterium]